MTSGFEGFDNPAGRLASRVYGTLQQLDQIRKQRKPLVRPNIPTISVGNIVAGGAGKTPMAIYLATHYQALGQTPSILSRGYGGFETGPAQVPPGSDPQRFGDEAVLMANLGLNVWVAKQREKAVAAAQDHADILILDDGFQRIELARDIDLLVFGPGGIGNGKLLPAGKLREPLSSLQRADALCGEAEHLPDLVPESPRFHFGYRRLIPGTELSPGTRVLALAGIANPDSFFQKLKDLDLTIVGTLPYRDHARFGDADLDRIESTCKQADADTLLVTAKDAVKLPDAIGNIRVVTILADYGPLSEETGCAFHSFLKGRLGV